MSKIGMEYPFNRISGKPMKECDTVFKMVFSQPYLYGHDRSRYKYNPTAAQLVQNTKFRRAAQQTHNIMADIDRVEPYKTAWRNYIKSGNTRYKTLRGYIFSQVYLSL